VRGEVRTSSPERLLSKSTEEKGNSVNLGPRREGGRRCLIRRKTQPDLYTKEVQAKKISVFRRKEWIARGGGSGRGKVFSRETRSMRGKS